MLIPLAGDVPGDDCRDDTCGAERVGEAVVVMLLDCQQGERNVLIYFLRLARLLHSR